MEWTGLPGPVLFALERLEKAGYEAALVGGCVRDRIMGRTPGDYDIATSAEPEETLRVFEGVRTAPTGLKHGTVMVIYEGMPMEITTFRQDGEYTDMRRPDSVRFTRSLREDVLRRDFTMNAMAWELGRGVIDHTGGAADIEKKIIRAVGEPERRFNEDALRILRAVRFSAQLGFAIEAETDRALRALHGNIGRIAAERVRVEIEKTICGKFAAETLMEYGDILRARLLGGERITDGQWEEGVRRLRELGSLHCGEEKGGAMLCWAALLLPMGAQGACDALDALRADKATVSGVQRRIALAAGPLDSLYALRCAVGDYGMETARDAALLRYAFDLPARQNALGLLAHIQNEKMPCAMAEVFIGGSELMKMGVSGPQIGRLLSALLDEVRAGRVPNEREALLKRAERLRNT